MPTDTVVKRSPTLPEALTAVLRGLMPSLDELLPPDIPLAQFRAALYLALTADPTLADCTPESLRHAVIQAATYGLLPGRDVHIIPFRSKRKGGVREATFIPSYQGLLRSLERSGKVRRAFAHAVYEGDEFACDYFDRPYHRPAVTLGKPQGKEVCYYGAVVMQDGTVHVEVLTLDDIEAVRRRAPAHEDGPWVTDRVMMARKTALKRVCKYVQLTPQGQQLLEAEERREREDISPERHAHNLLDLYGVEPEPGATVTLEADPEAPLDTAVGARGGHLLVEAIETLHRVHGGKDDASMIGYWAKVCKQAGVPDCAQLTVSTLTNLHKRVRDYYLQGEAQALSPEERAPSESTSQADDAQREA